MSIDWRKWLRIFGMAEQAAEPLIPPAYRPIADGLGAIAETVGTAEAPGAPLTDGAKVQAVLRAPEAAP